MHNEKIKQKMFLTGFDHYESIFRPILCELCNYRILTLSEIDSVKAKFNHKYQANALLRVIQIPFQRKKELIKNIISPFFMSGPICVELSDPMFARAIEIENIGMMDFSFPFDFYSKDAIVIYSKTSYRMAIIDWYESEDCTQIAEFFLFSDKIYNMRMHSLLSINRFDLSNFTESNILVVNEASIRPIMHIICGLANKIDCFSPFLLYLNYQAGLEELVDNEMSHFNIYITYRYEIFRVDENDYLVIQILPAMFGLTLYRGKAWAFDKYNKLIPAGAEESNNIYMNKLRYMEKGLYIF